MFTYYVVFVLMQEAAVASNLLGTMAIFQFIAVIAMIRCAFVLAPRRRTAWWWSCLA